MPGRIIVNSPGSIGALGGVYNDMVPTFSFGCGTGGGNSTTDNVNVYHYLNIKRVARRTQAHMWFRVPNQIYFNMQRGGKPAAVPVALHPHRHQLRLWSRLAWWTSCGVPFPPQTLVRVADHSRCGAGDQGGQSRAWRR